MSSKAFSLIVSLPDQDPATHELVNDSITIGRGPDNDIQILVSEVSVKHGEFKQEGESFLLVDLGSTNGTKINGKRLDEKGGALAPMDKIILGETVSAYFVPSDVLASTPAAELIASIEESSKSAPAAKPAPVAVAASPAAATPAKPAPVATAAPATPGASTVKLDQVRPSGPGPVQAPKTPGAGGAPSPPRPGAPKVAVPVAPGGAPAAPSAPASPNKAGQPPSPVPLKRPAPGSPPAAIPLPKSPPKPG